jgi:hypothetical protein
VVEPGSPQVVGVGPHRRRATTLVAVGWRRQRGVVAWRSDRLPFVDGERDG